MSHTHSASVTFLIHTFVLLIHSNAPLHLFAPHLLDSTHSFGVRRILLCAVYYSAPYPALRRSVPLCTALFRSARSVLARPPSVIHPTLCVFASRSAPHSAQPLDIRITLDAEANTFTIEDSGVGMSKEDMVQNLGTIARSGSKNFIKEHGVEGASDTVSDTIIGQFGVGFYSAYMAGHTIDVHSKSSVKGAKAHCWSSTGAGTFSMAESTELDHRGTKIVVHLKEDQTQFAKSAEVTRILHEYSNFVAHPILLDGEKLNTVEAIWAKSSSSVTDEECT